MDAQSQSEHPIGKGISRRTLAQVLAAGAVAATAGTPALAQQTSPMREASPQDYVRDPTRWGSPEVAALFPGFKHLDMRTKGAIIRVRHGGSGPPLLLLHGYPNNHVLWYAVAARLAERYHVVLADLRGYVDNSLPEPGPNHINYSFRAMAEDMIEVMANLGHQRFFLAGNDRGARTSHRLCLDHPDRVMRLCILDNLPNYHVWTHADKRWAMNSWHWTFLAQPEPFPETLLSAVSAEWYLKSRRSGRQQPPKVVFDEYVRCFTKKTITGSCRDYRAAATCDFEMDTADKDRRIATPTLILWGAQGPERNGEFLNVWRRYATNVDGEGLPCGHYMQEEVPDLVYRHFTDFFKA